MQEQGTGEEVSMRDETQNGLAQELGKDLTFLLAARGRLELDDEEWARTLERATRSESSGRAILRRARCFRVWHPFVTRHVGLTNTLHLPVDFDKAVSECAADPSILGAMILEVKRIACTGPYALLIML